VQAQRSRAFRRAKVKVKYTKVAKKSSNENSCGPFGPGSDIASKSGFFADFEQNGELKRFLRCNA
jgi:hypothetical protein